MQSAWKIAIDTGGTFTDCIASDPTGNIHRVKVLSTGRLRGRIEKIEAGNNIKVYQNWNLRKDLLQGYRFEILKDRNFYTKIIHFDPENSILKLSVPVPKSFLKSDFEVLANEEAPVLAARIVTETRLRDSLPSIDMRLGSTKGTNALLERKGVKPMLLITEGFADLPLIGTQQREHLFSLNIRKPESVCEQVVEVKERIDANGNILVGLVESEINKVLRSVYHSDNQVIVISLLNSYKNPLHEKILLNLLKAKGYKYVCASHQLGKVISFLPRVQTTLVNGYLMPVLSDYIKKIREKLDENSSLKLMTSSGGLVDSKLFHAKDSLLSGPAGGVIGSAVTAKKLQVNKILTFDMGGTSTDVARYAGGYDYIHQTRVADYTINSPALFIETVAAGGGSICSFDGFKFSVGPESAGAFPGPACYGAGGNLTITDTNLLLGRLFPGSFGIPVSSKYSRNRLKELKSEFPVLVSLPDEEILMGFFEIANEKMAKVIERISIAKGYEPSEYCLLAFGGAGGIHACKIAEILSINEIRIPFDAGILSAVGISSAIVERIIHRQVLKPWKDVKSDFSKMVTEMRDEGYRLLVLDGHDPAQGVTAMVFLYMRFQGQDATIEIAWSEGMDVIKKYKNSYSDLYGHYIKNRQIELESVKLKISGDVNKTMPVRHPAKRYAPSSVSMHKSFDGKEWIDTPVYDINNLKEGAYIAGPAVIVNATSTSFIDRNWDCIVNEKCDLIITRDRIEKNIQQQAINRPEQVQLELFTNRFRSITEEMGALLQRTAFSVNIKERLDFSCALLDAEGYLVVNAPHIPVHLGALGICTRRIIEKLMIEEGDIVVTNHPAYGGSHLPDVTMIAPVYYESELTGFVANRAHHGEIGGMSPGSMPADAICLEEEGVVLEPMYIARKGKVDYTTIRRLLSQSKYPSRSVSENIADLQAAVASIRKGIDLLKELSAEHGRQKVRQYMKSLFEYAGNCIQKKLQQVLHLELEAREKLDDGSVLCVKINKQNERYVFDFNGTSPQHRGNMNATPAIVNSVILYVLRLLIDEEIPLNEGILHIIHIKLPHCLLNPKFHSDPAKCPAVVGGNVEVSQRLVDTILKAFNLVACSQGTMNNLLFGDTSFGFYETICGGVGAGKDFSGASAVHQHMTNTKITDPEILELRYPVRIENYSIRKNSGGGGLQKGGDGVVRQIRFLKPVKLTLMSQHRKERPYGIKGGDSGKPGKQWLIKTNRDEIPLPGICSVQVETGEAVRIETPGGGGWGKRLID